MLLYKCWTRHTRCHAWIFGRGRLRGRQLTEQGREGSWSGWLEGRQGLSVLLLDTGTILFVGPDALCRVEKQVIVSLTLIWWILLLLRAFTRIICSSRPVWRRLVVLHAVVLGWPLSASAPAVAAPHLVRGLLIGTHWYSTIFFNWSFLIELANWLDVSSTKSDLIKLP